MIPFNMFSVSRSSRVVCTCVTTEFPECTRKKWTCRSEQRNLIPIYLLYSVGIVATIIIISYVVIKMRMRTNTITITAARRQLQLLSKKLEVSTVHTALASSPGRESLTAWGRG